MTRHVTSQMTTQMGSPLTPPAGEPVARSYADGTNVEPSERHDHAPHAPASTPEWLQRRQARIDRHHEIVLRRDPRTHERELRKLEADRDL